MHSETLTIAADHPALAGHFPGDPIVPGALLLDLVIQAARRQGLQVSGVRSAKFTAPLRPDERCRVEFTAVTDGVEFQVRGAAGSHARGTLAYDAQATEPQA